MDEELNLIARVVEKFLSIEGSNILSRISRSSAELSDLFTKDRASLRSYMNDGDMRSAYIAHYLLTNAYKVMHCIVEAERTIGIGNASSLNILDLGCGPGTALLATASYFKNRGNSLRLFGVDNDSTILSDAKKLVGMIAPDAKFDSTSGDISKVKIASLVGKNKFDIIIAANVINEIGYDDRSLGIVTSIMKDCLLDDGVLILIDPALKTSSRGLMWLRDRIVESKIADLISPCVHARPCPMLAANERDWCHFYLEWKRPQLIAKLDDLVGTDHRHLKMSYLILAKMGAMPQREDRSCCRAVSSPLVSNGKIELFTCTSCGELKKIRRLNKNRSPQNEIFSNLSRGDLVEVEGDGEVKKDTKVKAVERWQG